MITRTIGYIRVSTGRQAAEGVSLDAQEAAIRRWAEANGGGELVTFRDAGISGRKASNRPGLRDALAAVEAGAALVVYSLSRLARSMPDLFKISETLKRRGGDLVSLTERLDTTGASGKFLFNILGALAEFESAQIAERVMGLWEYKRRRGEKCGGAVPFGYNVQGKKLIPKAGEYEAIQKMIRLRRRGASLRRIAGALEKDGIRRPSGDTKWHPQGVKQIIMAEERRHSCVQTGQ